MRKTLLSVVIGTLALATASMAGAWIAIRSHWSTPIATVLVKNETKSEIGSVVISYTTCGGLRKLTYRALEQNASRPIAQEVAMKIVLCGEGGLTTSVDLNDGRTFSSTGSYVEGGYKVTERITEAGLVTELRSPF
ncbi:MAG: hypothetical protein KJ901_18850 [Gammaproteobacteria bacterium]|nr:hypothetical protein [Gammaproteobacteria bacterium]